MNRLSSYWPLAILGVFILLILGGMLQKYNNVWNNTFQQGPDYERLQRYLQEIPIREEGDPESAKELAYQVIDLADSLEQKLAMSQAYYWLAKIHLDQNTSNEEVILSKSLAQIALDLAQDTDNAYWESRILLQMAELYSWLERQESVNLDTMNYYLTKASRRSVLIKNNYQDSLFIVAHLQKDTATYVHKQALNTKNLSQEILADIQSSLQKSLLIFEEIGNLEGQGICLRNLGQIVIETGEFEQGISLFRDALKVNLEMASEIAQYNTLLKMGKAYVDRYSEKQDYSFLEKGIFIYREALNLSKNRRAKAYFRIGEAYHFAAAYAGEGSLEESTYLDSCGFFYQKAVEAAHEESHLLVVYQAINNAERICEYLKPDSKVSCHSLLQLANQAYFTISSNSREAQVESERNRGLFRQKQIRQQASSKRAQILQGGGLLLLILFSGAWIYYNKLKNRHQQKQLEAQQKQLEAQLKALQAQMNPHFISNSLNSIESLIHKNMNREAADYLVDFSHLSRMILSHCQQTTVTLGDEIEMLRKYLSLEKLRMGEKLSYDIQVEGEINQWKTFLPPMMLQPFVENAIWHGLKNKKENGNLSVTFRKDLPDVLTCIVEDDGVGRQKAKELNKMSAFQKISYSTQIIEERIDVLKQQIGANLQIIDVKNESGTPTGTRVIIHFHQPNT